MTNPKTLIAALVLYLVSTGVSYAAFNYITPTFSPSSSTQTQNEQEEGLRLAIDPSEPRDQECPLNGAYYTKTELEAWEERRPLLVMIENHSEARPQSGLNRADIVYEALAEGGVTRFMGVYYCGAMAKDTNLAPVRSARTYFLDWASEYGEYPLYAHVGGANCSADAGTGRCKSDKRVQALEQIQQYDWGGSTGNDMNQFSIGYPTFVRDYNRLGRQVATEHTMVSSTELLWELALERGWSNLSPDGEDWVDAYTPWEFQEEAKESDRGDVASINFDFWDGFTEYGAQWAYDSATNTYKRSIAGTPLKDLETDNQIETKNILILFIKEEASVDELKHMYYHTIGKGDGLLFRDGQVEEINWSKTKRTSRTLLTDSKGKPVQLTRGKIWIQVVAPNTEISY